MKRPQFSLRTLFIVVTVAGCGLGWLGIKLHDDWERERAEQEWMEQLTAIEIQNYRAAAETIAWPPPEKN